ncbi:hypothetical protein C8R44DRAFT_750524 [Mycena epipterygia]|nr:hypothetical protein C8R44DRAFT_750524 [Mycena epipterygia]
MTCRLAETTGVLVGLIEAGIYHDDDPLLEVPSNSIPGGRGNPTYDWRADLEYIYIFLVFSTTPQTGANGRVIGAPSLVPLNQIVLIGKMMGGSSGLNLMAWNRASKPEYDVWFTFSSSSTWSWVGLTSYFAKSQSIKQGQTNPFLGVSPAGIASSFTHGSANGPVNVSLNVLYRDVVPDYVKTWNALGLLLKDPNQFRCAIGFGLKHRHIQFSDEYRPYPILDI